MSRLLNQRAFSRRKAENLDQRALIEGIKGSNSKRCGMARSNMETHQEKYSNCQAERRFEHVSAGSEVYVGVIIYELPMGIMWGRTRLSCRIRKHVPSLTAARQLVPYG